MSSLFVDVDIDVDVDADVNISDSMMVRKTKLRVWLCLSRMINTGTSGQPLRIWERALHM